VFGFLGDVVAVIMTPLYYVVSGVLLAWRAILAFVLDSDSGWTWALAIIGLIVTVRVALIPLYIRQIRAHRAMRDLGPQISALQQAYKHDPKRLQQEQMNLWKRTGISPYASVLPLILQVLVFFVLFRFIDTAAKYTPTDGAFRRGFITEDQAESLSQAKILGVRLADTFIDSSHAGAKVLTLALVLVMCVTQFVMQRQEMTVLPLYVTTDDPYANQQRILLFVLPVVFAIGGAAFPLGVLIFWATSNAWSVGQHRHFHRDDPGPDPAPFS
jgi:YidC/Oxa1 family membrane protein insertase